MAAPSCAASSRTLGLPPHSLLAASELFTGKPVAIFGGQDGNFAYAAFVTGKGAINTIAAIGLGPLLKEIP